MDRMSAASDGGLIQMCLQAWIQLMAECQDDKATRDAVQEAEKRVAEFMKTKKEQAKGVLDRMSSGTDTGLLNKIMGAMVQSYKEDKEARRMMELMNGQDARFKSFSDRNKHSANGCVKRASEHEDTERLMRCFGLWVQDTRAERLTKFYTSRMENKRKQLVGLQSMFRTFATQLEEGIKAGTPRKESKEQRKKPSTAEASTRASTAEAGLPSIHKGTSSTATGATGARVTSARRVNSASGSRGGSASRQRPPSGSHPRASSSSSTRRPSQQLGATCPDRAQKDAYTAEKMEYYELDGPRGTMKVEMPRPARKEAW